MTSKQVLSIDQMKHLQELGLDMSDASMCWCLFLGDKKEKWELEIYEDVINQKRDSSFWEMEMHAITYKTRLLRDNNYYQTEGISYTDQEWVFFPMQ